VHLYTLDFETYYSKEYGLKALTTEAYIRDPRFEPILLGYKVDDKPTGYVSGRRNIQEFLDAADIENNAVLAHHAHFDGLIMSHHFKRRPKVWFDTLSMARAVHGVDVGGSLGKLLTFYDVGITKGNEVVNALGKRLADFTPQELYAYAVYCQDDVEGTYRIFQRMLKHFGKGELKQIDRIVRMFTEPRLEQDEQWLRDYAEQIKADKLTLLFEAGVTLDEVMSNQKFADALVRLGVAPPVKISKTTGKLTYAFAKNDKALVDLAEHDDLRVQTLVAARLGNKSTINETRAIRMADMAARGPACLYYKYAGAMQTMRVSGGDKLNWQNLQRVRKDKAGNLLTGHLRYAIYAPEGWLLVVADSSNIEARVLDYVAGQDNMLEVYRKADRKEGPDVYCALATKLFSMEVTKENKMERQVGKYTKLLCGYQGGWQMYKETVRVQSTSLGDPLILPDKDAKRYVDGYRAEHPMVVQLWNRAGNAIPAIKSGPDGEKYLDGRGICEITQGGIILPNKLQIKYPRLTFDQGERQWLYAGGYGKEPTTKLYGGKVVENLIQALSKVIVMEQTGEVEPKFRGDAFEVMTTHDEGVWLVKEDRAEEVLAFALGAMRVSPSWAPGLPLNSEGGIAVRYGDAK
jgi:hypothetical protein